MRADTFRHVAKVLVAVVVVRLGMSLPAAIIEQFSAGCPAYDIVVTRETSWALPLQITGCEDQPVTLPEDAVYTGSIVDTAGAVIESFLFLGTDLEIAYTQVALSIAQTTGLPSPVPGRRSTKGRIGRYSIRLTSQATSVIILTGDVYTKDPETTL